MRGADCDACGMHADDIPAGGLCDACTDSRPVSWAEYQNSTRGYAADIFETVSPPARDSLGFWIADKPC